MLQELIANNNFDLKLVDISEKATAEMLKYLSNFHRVILVYDKNCEYIADQFKRYEKFMFEADCKATKANAEKLVRHVQDFEIIVAIGSGSISDICKYTAYLSNKKFITYATAPSMNGYASSNASIIDNDGLKKSMQAKFPLAIFMDLNVISTAPTRLVRSGVGDLLCRSSCARDWKLSDVLFNTGYDSSSMGVLFKCEQEIIQNIDKMLLGDNKAVSILAHTLISAGLFMSVNKGSYPCSQAEHMVAHAYQYIDKDSNLENYHGEEISVTTYLMLRMQEFICDANWGEIVLYESIMDANIINEKNLKLVSLKKRLVDIKKTWQHTKHNILLSTLQSEKFKRLCMDSGLPLYCKDLKWDNSKYLKAIKIAPLQRDRFTFLDLASCFNLIDVFCSSQKL